jgi:hypothetical protein
MTTKKSVGRPKVENKLKTYSMRLPEDVVNWLDCQVAGRGKTIVELVRKEKQKQMDLFKDA